MLQNQNRRWIGSCAVALATLAGCGGGNPMITSPTTLRAAAQRHGLVVGTAADSGHFSEAQFTSVLSTEYSDLTPENQMKFGPIHPRPDTDPNPYDFAGPDALVAFGVAHKMKVRGHTLVWHSQLSTWVTGGGFDATQLSTILRSHIATVVGRYAGKIFAWDVVNEAFNDDGSIRSTIWYDSPGIGFSGMGTRTIEQSLNWAHLADPKAKLFYNDYGAETQNSKSDAIYAMASDFKGRGVPLGGVGFQFHVDLGFNNTGTLDSVKANFARFAALGLDIHVTELDIRLSDFSAGSLAAQADLYSKLIALCRTQPAVKLVQTWGFTDKYSWIPYFFSGMGWALPFDADYGKKPAYTAMFNALTAP